MFGEVIILIIILEMNASVRLGHKTLRTLMKRSSLWYLPGWTVNKKESPMNDYPAVCLYGSFIGHFLTVRSCTFKDLDPLCRNLSVGSTGYSQ